MGWHTAVWFERQKYPWPLAQRENLFALHMEPSDGGDRVRIVQCSIELPSQPLVTHTHCRLQTTFLAGLRVYADGAGLQASGLVRSESYVVHEMAKAGDDTEWSMHMEFNAGGR